MAAIHELSAGQIDCGIADLLKSSGVPLLRSAPAVYNWVSTTCPSLYNLVFRLTNGSVPVSLLGSFTAKLAAGTLAPYFREVNPKTVVVIHPFLIGQIAGAIREKYRLPFRIATVVTDPITIHASWAFRQTDLCIVATEYARERLLHLGLSASSVTIADFPVHPVFRQQRDRKIQSRHQLGLAESNFTVLVVGGRAGAGINLDLIDQLTQIPELQVLVVAGENEALRQKVARVAEHRSCLHVYGWVANMQTVVSASDIVISKAGPSTIFEAASMERPLIITGAIGIQERGNIPMVLNRRWGSFCSTTAEVVKEVARGRANYPLFEAAERSEYRGAYQIAQMLIDL
jgi:1,2-diacylglycerol 3-beta-galactosyltransferase